MATSWLDGNFRGIKDLQYGRLAHPERQRDVAHRLTAFIPRRHVHD